HQHLRLGPRVDPSIVLARCAFGERDARPGTQGAAAMMSNGRARLTCLVLSLLTVAASACAPQGQPGASSSVPSSPERSAPARKVLTIADSYEPKFIIESYTSEFFPQGNNVKYLVQDNLVRTVQYQTYEPQLATEVPSLE